MLNIILNKFNNLFINFKTEIKNKILIKNINLNFLYNIKVFYINKFYHLVELANIKIINQNTIHIIPYINKVIKIIFNKIKDYNLYFKIVNKKNYLLLEKKSIDTLILKNIIIKLKNIYNTTIIKLKILREKLIKKIKTKELSKDDLYFFIKKININHINMKKKIYNFYILYKKNI
ncbi:MAG: ribosome recycling factor [Candidatus Shikimatogenerans sp. Tser]|uniref:Ribosome recycling factor n=1 Tax=Candidatus Shikimatogenerans sp. Tser TaxID=3158568 RepID=A0AAU7QT00_9FLAO